MSLSSKPVKVAVLDLYNGVENQGMRCIREILASVHGTYGGTTVTVHEFDVRSKTEIPDSSYDIYISSGGPGSPYDGEGSKWEAEYFKWLDAIWSQNTDASTPQKFVLSICHSFQLMSRHFDIAEVEKRKSDSFGVLPVHLTEKGKNDELFSKLTDPFYAADFREWQVLQPKMKSIQSLGASILALEKIRPHVPLERAVMAMRISPEIVGTQFHPEADPEGMFHHFAKEEQREKIIKRHSKEKFNQIMHRLTDPEFLKPTYHTFIPSFIEQAIQVTRPELFSEHSK
ncbi:MAG: GMP synthase [Bacteroidetes bacterium]|nr:GMP synthase [Bacteroidota bacterium]MCH8524065.1 hypothetical protein [Balneolales bacterium]